MSEDSLDDELDSKDELEEGSEGGGEFRGVCRDNSGREVQELRLIPLSDRGSLRWPLAEVLLEFLELELENDWLLGSDGVSF